MKKATSIIIFLLLFLCACNQQKKIEPAIATQTMITAENTSKSEEIIGYNKLKDSNKINKDVAPTIATETKSSEVNIIKQTESSNIKVEKKEINKDKSMKEEVENLFNGMIATIDIGNDEIRGERVVDCLLTYPSDIDPSMYISQLKAAEQIISRYVTDEYKQIIITIKCPGYEDDIITLGYYGTIILRENIDQINKVMNNDKKYLSLDEASKTLDKWLITLDNSAADKTFWNVRINGDNVDYMYNALSIKCRTFYVNASDGSITTLFDGEEYVSVQDATQNQIDAVLSFLTTQNQNIENIQNVKGLLINNKFIDLLSDEVDTPFLLEESDGNLAAVPYEEFTGD